MSGVSASTSPPVVRLAISSTAAKPTALAPWRIAAVGAAATGAGAIAAVARRSRGASRLSSGGARVGSAMRTSHRTTQKTCSAGRLACVAARSAASPCHGSIRPIPIAPIRALTAPPDAMPDSDHGPHPTLAPATPCARWHAANASRATLAAA